MSKNMFFARFGDSDDITKALNDEHQDVRYSAVSNSNATHEHITKGLNDKDSDVRSAAQKRLNSK